MIESFFQGGEGYSGRFLSEFELTINKLVRDISEVSSSNLFKQLQAEKPDLEQLTEYKEILKPIQESLDIIKQQLEDYQLELETIQKDLLAADLSANEKLQYQRILHPEHGVEAQLNTIRKKRSELDTIEKKQFAKLTKVLHHEENKGLLASLNHTFGSLTESLKQTMPGLKKSDPSRKKT